MTQALQDDAVPSRRRAWFTVILLLTLYLCAMVDRNIISVLVVPIREDLGIGEFELGLLLGPAFGITYVLFAIPFAWWADRWSRRGVVFVGIVIWSISNTAAAFTHSFETLFLARAGVGAGEAALVPAAYVLIAQLFPRRTLAMALSIFSLGSIGGMAVSYGFGGWLLDSLQGGAVLPFVGRMEAWRMVFFVTGIPALLIGVLLLAVPEKRRPTAAALAAAPLLPFLRRHGLPALGIPLAFGTASLCSAALVAWLPTYMMPTFEWTATRVGAVLGAMFLIVASLGKIASGFIVDRLFAGGMKDAHPRFLMVGLMIALPATLASFFMSGPVPFVLLLGFWFLLAYPLQGYGAAAMQIITPEPLRGRMSAIFIVVTNLMATLVGATMVGYLSEHVFDGPGSLGLGIVTTLAIWGPVTILLLWLILAPTRRAVDENRLADAG